MMTSAELSRRAPYSADLRWCVVCQKIAMELPYRKIMANLNIATGTAVNIYHRFCNTGKVEHTKQPHRLNLRALTNNDELFVIGLVLDNPSLYLSKMRQLVLEVNGKEVNPSTICRVILKHGFTRKKIQHVAKQRSLVYRGWFLAEVHFYRREQLVFIDETGCKSKDHVRRMGYAMRGETPIQHRWLHKGEPISAIAAMSSSGMIAVEMKKGSVNGDVFFDFVHGSLIPQMLPYDGENPRSIAVLDNCSIHHIQPVLDLFRMMGILVLFLPPYSPDIMPIELLFTYIKYYLKDHDEIWQAMNHPTVLLQAAFDSVNQESCTNWITSCGY